MKRCALCGDWYPIEEFYPPTHQRVEPRDYCSFCAAQRSPRDALFEYLDGEYRKRCLRKRDQQRRAIAFGAYMEDFSEDDLRESWEERNLHACYWCGVEWNDRFQADHAVPLARGGPHVIANIVPSCHVCNASKGSKLAFEEWVPPITHLV